MPNKLYWLSLTHLLASVDSSFTLIYDTGADIIWNVCLIGTRLYGTATQARREHSKVCRYSHVSSYTLLVIVWVCLMSRSTVTTCCYISSVSVPLPTWWQRVSHIIWVHILWHFHERTHTHTHTTTNTNLTCYRRRDTYWTVSFWSTWTRRQGLNSSLAGSTCWQVLQSW